VVLAKDRRCLLRPRYVRRWPELKFPDANVLCEGPSIEKVRAKDLLYGPTIAVNHALALSGRLPIDCWATIDHPMNLWEWGKDYLRDEVKLFTTENNLLLWEKAIGEDEVNKRIYALKPTYMESVNGSPALLGANGKPALIPTLIHVLGWLSHMGTKRVRIFGSDMYGSGSNLSFLPFSESEDIGWKCRWAVERRLLALSMKQYRNRGQRLERWAQSR